MTHIVNMHECIHSVCHAHVMQISRVMQKQTFARTSNSQRACMQLLGFPHSRPPNKPPDAKASIQDSTVVLEKKKRIKISVCMCMHTYIHVHMYVCIFIFTSECFAQLADDAVALFHHFRAKDAKAR